MTWQSVKLVGFAPDAPEDTPGIFTYSDAIVPTSRGFSNSGYPTPASSQLNDYANNGAVVTKVDGTDRIFVGTSSKIYEYDPAGLGTTTDRSGLAYSASNSVTWSFAQFGDVTLAVNKNNTLQACTTGNFAAVSGAPKATIVVTPSLPQLQFAMCFNYDDGTNNYQDGVFWSAGSNYADWTPSIATGCGNVRVTDIGGPFTAAIPFRDGVVAFKRRSMYLGRYVGPPAIWEFERISADVGCIGKVAVVEANDALYFIDEHGFWRYDGSYPQQVPGAVRQFWATYIAGNSVAVSGAKNHVRATWDKQRNRLWFSYGADGTGSPANYLVYNPDSGFWAQHGVLKDNSLTYGVGAMISADYAYAQNATPYIHTLSWNSSSSRSATIRLHALGNSTQSIQLNRVRPEWLVAPTSSFATGRVYRGRVLRNVLNSNAVLTQDADGYFDVTVADRFLQPEVTVNANTSWELAACSYDVQSAGAN